MTKTLKVGILGLGGIANLHIGGWQASPLAEVVTGSDINPEQGKLWKKKYDLPHFTTDPADIIRDPDIDIIDICTPNNFHAELAIAALEAGKHVLCEKPLAPTEKEIRAMIDARDRSGKLLMTAQHFRFTGASQALKKEIETGVLGNVYHARAWWLRRAGLPIRPTFIYKELAFAGVGIDIGVHVIDLTLWLMGNPKPVSVSGVARTELAHQDGAFSIWGGDIPQDMDVDEFAAAFVRFDNGATMMAEVSWLMHHATQFEDLKVWLYGDKGGTVWPDCSIHEANNQTKQHYDRSLNRTQDEMKAHHLECVIFARAITEGAPSPVPPEQSLEVGRILQGIYESQALGREVRL